jgi:hypothetical protein
MATHGETINQVLPVVTVTGATSGSFTVDPSLATSGNTGTIGVTPVDKNRIVRHNYKKTLKLPVMTGVVTVTITPASGTEVHYTLNSKNPKQKALLASTSNIDAVNKRTNRARDAITRIYTVPFTIQNSRPGTSFTEIRVRAYSLNAKGQKGISPNEKSKVMIIRFVIHH